MFDANDYKSTCKFSEEIVSYLYDEMNVAEKAGFESHLASCPACLDEVSGFGVVLSEVTQWKEKEVFAMPLPVIEIPYKTTEKTENKRSWWVSVSEVFTLSPTWATATTAFAALAICLSLVFLAVSSFRQDKDDDVVVQNGSKQSAANSSQLNQAVVNGNNSSNVNSKTGEKKEVGKSPEPKNSNDGVDVATVTEKPVVVKTTTIEKPKTAVKSTNVSNSQKTQSTKTNNQNVPKVNVNKNADKVNNVPNFIDEEEEDDSLRLTDLLNEIDSK